VFVRRKYRGLNRLEIAATDEQFEILTVAMNTAANPRATNPSATNPSAAGAGAGLDGRSRQQKLLDGLVGACRVALATDRLPSTGGNRAQVLVTLGYDDLFDRLRSADPERGSGAPGSPLFGFGGPVSAKTIRKIACDADIIPVVLGGAGEVLDMGRAQRLFTPKQRKALIARDRGCAFPGCTIPAHWCEAHHIRYWQDGGLTNVSEGVLLCSHHHLLHENRWMVQLRQGIPWFTPPGYLDPDQKPRRNHYWNPAR
jgi:hypothetical protein